MFDSSRKFIVEVRYAYGLSKLRFEAEVEKQFDGRLYEKVKGVGGGSF